MITIDPQFRIQIDELASGQVVLRNMGADLLDGSTTEVHPGENKATAVCTLASGAVLHIEMSLKPAGSEAVVLTISLANAGSLPVCFDCLDSPRLQLDAGFASRPLWTMQGAAVGWGQDFAFELPDEWERENFLGHIQDGEGGGIPVVYFWNRAHGMALMHIEPQPKDWYMPVQAGEEGITAALQLRKPVMLQPGEVFSSPRVVISIHRGDFFEPLALYRRLLAARGVQAPEPVPANYEPAWCSWGYEFDVQPSEMTGVLPVLSELGIRWLTLDDRWFDAYGDWNPRLATFPGGVEDMRRMNAEIHAAGAFSQIWWYPLCTEDGFGEWESHRYGVSKLLKDHPDWVILNPDGSVARNNRHLAMLCPALPEVQAHTAEMTRRFIHDWGFDGHKLDNIYTVPPCYNPAHHHEYPEKSTEAMADVYRLIFEITRDLRPDSVTQICPCGTPLSLQLIPFTDQSVTADPTSSRQIRQRIKFYKALMGPTAAVFADHVELSDGGNDFASEIGTGGVPATKFIWPEDEAVQGRLQEVWDLPADKKTAWKWWFDLYNEHRLASGEYLNLYDLAFDQPEAHAIRTSRGLYLAFFTEQADQRFDGRVELRGLDASKTYRVSDYVHEGEIARVDGRSPTLDVSFSGSLLLLLEEI